MQLKNDLLLRALKKEATPRRPIWVMRQAGRYLPEYRKVRAQAGDFMTLASTPEMACEVTLQPIRRYGLDAAIIFSDILTIPDAMGMGLHFVTGEGPRFEYAIRSEKDVEQLPIVDADALSYVMDAISLTVRELDGAVPLIGFCGSPWTVMTYMVENGSSKSFSHAKSMLFKSPQLAHRLLDKITQSTISYLLAQINSGASVIQIFDSWGGALSPHVYKEFSLKYMQEIVTAIRAAGYDTPIILFSKGVTHSLGEMAETGCDGLGLDWTIRMQQARQLTGNRVALQGNMDPNVLYADEAFIRKEVKRVLSDFGDAPGHIFNLGHGMQPDMDPEKLAILIDAVQTAE
ncbi:uroporphyrinogen decarboxylase [Marinicella sp. W31]|uniref:uroporphyrinogen decarboxylase n=1 Tax=Marinicella sp. W31 TaxID=3023713 RepID=UPI0037579B20